MIALDKRPNRRRADRHRVPGDTEAVVSILGAPGLEGTYALRDISLSGMSFVVSHEIRPLEAGDSIRPVEVRALGHVFRGELLVMHLTPGPEPGAVCGGLFYPETDEDLLAARSLVRVLEARSR